MTDQAKTTVSDDTDAVLAAACRKYNIGTVARLDELVGQVRDLSARRATADVTECLDRAEKRLVEFARSVDDGLSQGGAREWERRIWASFAELRDLAALSHQAPE